MTGGTGAAIQVEVAASDPRAASPARSEAVAARLRAALPPGRAGTPEIAGALRRVATLDWVSAIPSSAAPGFVYLAGSLGGIGVGGGGADLAEALLRLSGEAAEVAAQRAAPLESAASPDPAIDAIWVADPAGPRIGARNIARGTSVGAPAAAVHLAPHLAALRHPHAPPTSLGLAAGPDAEAARRAAILELVERDAAAAWWGDGRRPRAVDAALAAPAGALLARLRRGATQPRPTVLLALDAVAGVPVVAAISTNPDGAGLAVGLKASLGAADALRGAAIELLQMELALEMARRRSASGRSTPGDALHLARAALRPDRYPALRPGLPLPLADCPARDFAGLAEALRCAGLEVTIADLPAAKPHVAKALVPGLRPLPGGRAAARPGAPGTDAALM